MSRIGIAIWNFEGERLGPKLRWFAEMGYTAACINNRALDSLSDEEESEAAKVTDEFDLALTFHGGLLDTPAIARAERIVRWHKRTGRIACTSYDVPGAFNAEGFKRKQPERIVDVLKDVLAVVAGTGVRVLLEDCPIFPEDVEQVEGLAEKHPGLGILVDLGHMNLRLRDPEPDSQPLRPGAIEAYLKGIPWKISEIHVHSNNGIKDQHAPPYAPNADLVTAARVLSEIGFDGISTIEFAPGWCGMPPEEVEHACRRSLEYWRGLL